VESIGINCGHLGHGLRGRAETIMAPSEIAAKLRFWSHEGLAFITPCYLLAARAEQDERSVIRTTR
jgi:hypothetical protein